jgi:enterochelin esterase-like enzyme
MGSSMGWGGGADMIRYYGYDDCIRLRNDRVSVVLCPAAGGRVLEYSLEGKNVLYLPAGDEGWRMTPDAKRGPMHAGRFDIGPEKVVRRGNVLWMGPWRGEITGDRSARLTSEFDPQSGARLVRDFQLHETSSQLRCTQTIINQSEEPISLCHWSRTFAVGGGIAVVPRSPRGRFPNGYVMYEPDGLLKINPNDPNIQVSEQAVIVSATPAHPKLGFDSHAGWLAYLAPTDQLFVKRFATYPDRAYNEFAALTISVWYPEGEMVELEPIGPAENLEPGERASFSEDWWLLPHKFPQHPDELKFDAMKDKVLEQTQPPGAEPESVVSPEIHEDGRVTFRFVGQQAETVQVDIGEASYPLDQDVDLVWSYTTQPLEPGIYDYTFQVDGVRVTDPRNRWIKKWLECASMFEIPGDPPRLTELQDVAHGVVHRHIYASKTTGGPRATMVYTPPQYDATRARPYPVVVLCHGHGDDETAWTEVGRAHHIVDNLIAEGKIEPMVIVMPHGHPVPLAEETWSEDYGGRNRETMVRDVVDDLLPLVDRKYHVTDEAARRAIVGLSMGGGHAIRGGMLHPDKFAWVGAFSASTPEGELAKQHPELLDDVAGGAASRKLFWIACGTSDSLIDRNRQFNEQLNQHRIRHTYVETDGGHDWILWRDYLPRFLQLLFRD